MNVGDTEQKDRSQLSYGGRHKEGWVFFQFLKGLSQHHRPLGLSNCRAALPQSPGGKSADGVVVTTLKVPVANMWHSNVQQGLIFNFLRRVKCYKITTNSTWKINCENFRVAVILTEFGTIAVQALSHSGQCWEVVNLYHQKMIYGFNTNMTPLMEHQQSSSQERGPAADPQERVSPRNCCTIIKQIPLGLGCSSAAERLPSLCKIPDSISSSAERNSIKFKMHYSIWVNKANLDHQTFTWEG